MRQICDRLRDALELHAIDIVKDQGKNNGDRKCKETVKANHQCVADNRPKLRRIEEIPKPFKPCPLAPYNAVRKIEIPKCNLNAIHRCITKNDDHDCCGEQHQIKRPILSGKTQFLFNFHPS